jgi:hypothetical protein
MPKKPWTCHVHTMLNSNMLLAFLWHRCSSASFASHMVVHGGDGLRRLVSQQRKLSTNKIRKPWRHRTKHTILRKTPAEKAEAAAKRSNYRQSYNDALSKARGIVMEQATLLREEFGGHTAEWHFEEIMQRARMSKSKRSTSRWNAFLWNEVKSINDGDIFSSFPDRK